MFSSRIPAAVPSEVDDLARIVVDAVSLVRKKLGSGINEEIYKIALSKELSKRGIAHVRDPRIPIDYDGEAIGYCKPDFLICDVLVLEAKAVEDLSPAHFAQTLTYLRFTGCPLGLLVNFHAVPLGPGIRRVVPGTR